MALTDPVPPTTSHEPQSMASSAPLLSPATGGTNIEERRDRCIKALRSRARTFTYNALADVCMIFVALVFMSNSFALADRLSRLEEETTEYRAEIDKTQAEQSKMLDQMSTKTKKLQAATDQFSNDLDRVQVDPASPEPGVKRLQEAISGYQAHLSDITKDEFPESSAIPPPPSDTRYLIQTVSTWIARFGILICGLFLIQILVSRYRFNSRLASQYDAMADSLELASDWAKLEFDKLLLALTPRLDFGPMPKPMVQDLTSLAAHATETAKKG